MKKKLVLVLVLFVIALCSVTGCGCEGRGLTGYPEEVNYIVQTENAWYGANDYVMLENGAIILDGSYVYLGAFGAWNYCGDKITLYHYEKLTEVRR